MASNSHSSRASGKTRDRTQVRTKRTQVRSISPIVLKFQTLFKTKTALELALRTGLSVSGCEKVLAGKRDLGAGFQQELLKSDVGGEILTAIMGDARPAWWASLRRQVDISNAKRAASDALRRIDALEKEGA